ncbi:hypothetical protein WDZ11_14710 [Roseomonas mucosa]|uniref:hypothetical protein n=1 Tax=Roseomonas mucosa TaxID=207340 RepID=UPI0030CDDA2B
MLIRVDGPRAAARSAGQTRYSTGAPCKHGHYAERLVVNGSCLECVALKKSQRDKEYYQRNSEKRKEYAKAWRNSNLERCRKRDRDKHARNRENELVRMRLRYLLHREADIARKRADYHLNIEARKENTRARYRLDPRAVSGLTESLVIPELGRR